MIATEYRFKFSERVAMPDVEETLLMSVIAAEGIHGRARVRLDGRFTADTAGRTCTVNADNAVGQDIARMFTELLSLEVGESEFEMIAESAPCRCPAGSDRGSK